MANDFGLLDLGTKTAAGNYSSASSQFTVVKSTAANFTKQTSAGGIAIGVLQDLPSSGQPGVIRCIGISKVRVNTTAHSAIAVGDKLCASTGAGVIGSTTVARYVLGRALTSLSSNSTGIIDMLLTHEGAGSSGAKGAA